MVRGTCSNALIHRLNKGEKGLSNAVSQSVASSSYFTRDIGCQNSVTVEKKVPYTNTETHKSSTRAYPPSCLPIYPGIGYLNQ